MPYHRYIGVTEERHETLMNRYKEFVINLDSKTHDPIDVFDPLNAKQLEELQLIRETSKELQKKKEEDMKKAQATETEAEPSDLKLEQNVNGTEKPHEENI